MLSLAPASSTGAQKVSRQQACLPSTSPDIRHPVCPSGFLRPTDFQDDSSCLTNAWLTFKGITFLCEDGAVT